MAKLSDFVPQEDIDDYLEDAPEVLQGKLELAAEVVDYAQSIAPVDILVTDINLPGAPGTELAARARELRPQVAIVFATGDASTVAKDDRASILVKPYSDHTLLAALGGDLLTAHAEVTKKADTDPA